MGIGKRIKEARESLKMTQKDLGDIVGVTASAITNYENDTSHPKEEIMYKIFRTLKRDPNYFFQDCVEIEKPATEYDDGSIQEIIDGLNRLSPEKREIALAMIRAMQSGK